MTTPYRPNPWCCGLEHDDNNPDTCPTRATCNCGTCGMLRTADPRYRVYTRAELAQAGFNMDVFDAVTALGTRINLGVM